MATTLNANNLGSLLGQAQGMLAQAQGGGGATGATGAAGATATVGAANPTGTAGAAATTDTSRWDAMINARQPIPGYLTATGTGSPMEAEQIISKGGMLGFTTKSMGGNAVQVVKASNGFTLSPPTGRDEIVQVDGRMLRFDASGRNLNNFQVAERDGVPVEFDRRQGIAAGIGNLSRVVAARQERLKNLSEALAQDAQETGSTNQLDIQRLMMEQQVTENLSQMNHKIYESVQQSVRAWLQ